MYNDLPYWASGRLRPHLVVLRSDSAEEVHTIIIIILIESFFQFDDLSEVDSVQLYECRVLGMLVCDTHSEHGLLYNNFRQGMLEQLSDRLVVVDKFRNDITACNNDTTANAQVVSAGVELGTDRDEFCACTSRVCERITNIQSVE